MDNSGQRGQRTITINAHPFDWHDKIGYMFGDIGNNFSFNVVNSFLMIFYTNVYGLTGSQTAIVFLLARFIDAISDVVVGRLVDNSKLHKRGRFIPWMQRMEYPLLIALVLLFVPMVKDWPMAAKMAWVWVTYIAWGFCILQLISHMVPWHLLLAATLTIKLLFPLGALSVLL